MMLGIAKICKDECLECGSNAVGVWWENVWFEREPVPEKPTSLRRVLQAEIVFSCLKCFTKILDDLEGSPRAWLPFADHAEKHRLWSPTMLEFLAMTDDVVLEETEDE